MESRKFCSASHNLQQSQNEESISMKSPENHAHKINRGQIPHPIQYAYSAPTDEDGNPSVPKPKEVKYLKGSTA